MIDVDKIFKSDKSLVENGDIIYYMESKDTYKALKIEVGKVFQNRFGHFNHDDFIGKPLGSRISSRSKTKNEKEAAFITIVDLIPALWEKAAERITQILFSSDMSLILSLLDIRSDYLVLESGTGSGCLSLNIANCIDSGHLYTFEFNKERADKLLFNFNELRVNDKITITNQDVIEEGFKLTTEKVRESDLINYKNFFNYTNEDIVKQSNEGTLMNGFIDCVFIDLPNPWMAISSIKRKLKSNGNLVSFSPCIEQVTKTVEKMKEEGFIQPRTFEIQLRTHNYVKTETVKIPLYNKDINNTELTNSEIYLFDERSDHLVNHTQIKPTSPLESFKAFLQQAINAIREMKENQNAEAGISVGQGLDYQLTLNTQSVALNHYIFSVYQRNWHIGSDGISYK